MKLKIQHSPELAEFIGILFGDGYINKYGKYNYVIEIAGHAENDLSYHQDFIHPLIHRLFSTKPKFKIRKDQKTLYTHIFSKNVYSILRESGMPEGKKTNLTVPEWIKNDIENFISFVRGFFDTDGSIILRKRKQNSISFCSKNSELLIQIKKFLESLGFFVCMNKEFRADKRGFKSTSHYLRINRKAHIKRFAEKIESSNPYKLRRLRVGTRGFEPRIEDDTPRVASFT